jgi:hypothetical protein
MPYLVLAGLLLALMVMQTLNRQWSSDYWVHQATVETFRHDLIDPVNELTHSRDASPSYTPYTFALAATARATGWASVTVLQVAAIANLIAFLAGFQLFVAELTRRRLAPFFALLATLVLWGVDPWRWSGLLSLNSIGFGLPYPSMFATAVALFVGWGLLRYDDRGTRWWLLLVGGGFATILLTHPFTGVWTGVLMLAVGINRRLYRRERVVPLVVTAVVVLGVLALWPYYPFFELTKVGEAYQQAPLYEGVPWRLVAAAPGFYIVFRRFQRNRTDPLALMLVGALAIYVVGWITHDSNLGRVLPLVLLSAHIAIGVLLADMVERHARPSPTLLGWLAVSAAVGLLGVAPGVVRTIPHSLLPGSLRDKASLQAITKPYSGLEGALPFDSVAIADTSRLREVAPAYGIGLVRPARPTPFVDDVHARQKDAFWFLRPSTSPPARREIEAKYGIDGVLCGDDGCVRRFTTSRAGGEVVARGRSWTLIRLPSP